MSEILIIYLCVLTLHPVWIVSWILFNVATGKESLPTSRDELGFIGLWLFVLVTVAALGWGLYFFTRFGLWIFPLTAVLSAGGPIVMTLLAIRVVRYFDAKHARRTIYVMGSPGRFQYSRTFTEDEYEQLSTALPQGAHPGWYAVLRDQTLCIYRASGWCCFQLKLERGEGGWRVSEAWSDSRGRYANEEYVSHLVNYVLDGLMFGRSVQFPISKSSMIT